MTDTQKETAVQGEQQFKDKNKIMHEIIDILAKNDLSISDARNILNAASHTLGNQKITSTFY